MDRSDDLTRNRRFNSLDLGKGRTRPRIVTSRDERVAPQSLAANNRPPQPSLEFRARQRLRTYAEASTIMDRQTPRDASAAMRHQGASHEPLSPADTTPERAFSDVVPEPPSPMAEAYVGRTPQLTQREALNHNLEASTSAQPETAETQTALDEEAAPTARASDPRHQDFDLDAPAISALRATEASPAAGPQGVEDAPAAPVVVGRAGFDEMEDAYQSPRPARKSPARAARDLLSTINLSKFAAKAGPGLGKIGVTAQRFTSRSVTGAKSLVAKVKPLWHHAGQRVTRLTSSIPALSQISASTGEGVKGRVSRLPANSLLTPQAGSLAASARADASNTRPDANVRPLRNEGILGQEPEPKRTLLARRIQDDVERTESRTATPVGPITTARRGRMALSALALIVVTLLLLGLGAWVTVSILQRTNSPVAAIGETERYRIEAILDALFIDPGTVDGVIDDRTMAAIGLYATEYGYSGPKEITTGLLQHLEDEADAMGVLDLIQ